MSAIPGGAMWAVLRDVPYKSYVRHRRAPGNRGLRMTYYDGTLEILSPEFRHETASGRFDMLIRAVMAVHGIRGRCAGSTTFRRGGALPKRGHGKEADTSFYFANADRVRGKAAIDLDVDPPPDLWIEVDNRGSSKGRLPLYAALGVPEVWRYRAPTGRLRFDRLDSGSYVEIDRSVALPMLTPADVLAALARIAADDDETAWDDWLRAAWAPGLTP